MTRVLQIPEPVMAGPAFPVSAAHVECPGERRVANATERVQHDGAAGGGKTRIEVPYKG